MLIARALPIMRVYIKPGGQRGYSGAGVPGNLAPPKIWPPLRKFGPLENIVYFTAITLEIVKLLLKTRP